MEYGRTCKPGSLPVFSVDTEEEAVELLTLACETNILGQWLARELVFEQSLDNLQAFSNRLARTYEWMHSLDKDPEKFPRPPRIGVR